MKFISFEREPKKETGLVIDQSIIPINVLNKRFDWDFPEHLDEIFHSDRFFELKKNILSENIQVNNFNQLELLSVDNVKIAPLYHHPSKIWGIGLNYRDHASDLDEQTPSSIPASFMKADTTIIGYGDTIQLPPIAEKTTGEAELGIIFGKKCKSVERENWLKVIAGFTCVIDMTAESILRKNPRYLTISKNFDSFFSFGPMLLTPEEILDIDSLHVATILDDKTHARNSIQNMTFPPDFLVSFHSEVMTFLPGDIISTGTPRAVELKHGSIVGCKIDGFPLLSNPVSTI